MDFTAVKDFYSPELKSQYCAGMGYTARDPADPKIAGKDKKSTLARGARAKLRELLPQWIADGLVVAGRSSGPRVGGEG